MARAGGNITNEKIGIPTYQKKIRGFPRRSATSELKKSREFVDETVFRITDSCVKFLGWYTLREYIDCVESGFQRRIPRVIHFASDTIPTLLFYDAKRQHTNATLQQYPPPE